MKSVSAITSRPGAGAAVAGILIGAGIMLVGALLLNDTVAAKLTSLAPPATALVVAYVGLQQWLTAREKVRLDLYTRRFANLQTAVRYFQVATGERLDLDEAQQTAATYDFIAALMESRFLFDHRVHASMQELRTIGFRYAAVRKMGPIQGEGHETALARGKQHHEDYAAMGKLLEELQLAMAPFLSFGGRH